METKAPHILVVDDEEDLCEILKFNLETEGYQVDTAFSGEMDSFYVYVSEDLENWAGPYTIYENDGSFRADSEYWAPEVYEKDGEYYICLLGASSDPISLKEGSIVIK